MIFSNIYGIEIAGKDDLVMNDVFWLYDLNTDTGCAGFEIDGVIYVARKRKADFHHPYWLDTSKPEILTEKEVDKFIKNEKKISNGVQVVFNTLTDEFHGVRQYKEKDMEERIALCFSTANPLQRWLVGFIYKDIKKVKEGVKAQETLASIRDMLVHSDLKVPVAAETLGESEVKRRYDAILKMYREEQPKNKITMTSFALFWESLRHVLHYAVKHNQKDLLQSLNENFVLSSLEPITDYIMLPLITGNHLDVQDYFLSEISYKEYPWRNDFAEIIRAREMSKEDVKAALQTVKGKELFKRYFEDNWQ